MKCQGKQVLLTAAVILAATASSLFADIGAKKITTINGKKYLLEGTSAEIATWKNGALGVYTAIHDDMGADNAQGINWHMDTVLYNRGLVGAPGVITSSCDIVDVNDMKRHQKHGHELISHSWKHGGAQSNWDADLEIVQSKKWMDSTLQQNTTFFIFPFDQWTPLAISQLKAAGYLGARSGDRQVITDSCKHAGIDPHYHNAYDFADPFDLVFDVYGEKHSGYQYMKTRAGGDDKHYFMKAHVAAAINNHGWSIREFHGIEDASWESIPLADYQSWMDYIKTQVDVNNLWMANPTRVIKYRFTREYAGTPSLTANAGGYSLSFGTSSNSAELAKYNTTVTVFVKTSGISQHIKAVQGGKTLETAKISDNSFTVEVNPTLGDVTIEESQFPYVKIPVLDELDTLPSKYPQWYADAVYPGNDTVFYNGKEYRNKYWTQANNPESGIDWVFLNDVSNQRVVNSRAVLWGSVSPKGKNIVAKTEATTVFVTPENGYQIDSVVVNGVNKGQISSVDIPADGKAYAIDAFFGYAQNIEMVTVTATAGANGSITPNSAVTVAKGSSKQFKITPNDGYLIDMITVNGVSQVALKDDTLFTLANILGNSTLNATFKVNPITVYSVKTTVHGNGSVLPGTSVSAEEGTPVTLQFIPDNNNQLDSIIVDGVRVVTAPSINFAAVTANSLVDVYFSVIPAVNYQVTATAGLNGTITPLDTVVVAGSDISYTITPDVNFSIEAITVDGVNQTVVNPFILNNVVKDQVVAVSFKANSSGGICNGVALWDENEDWTSYTVGDKRIDAAKVYECIAPAYAIYPPSSAWGYYGWKEIGICE